MSEPTDCELDEFKLELASHMPARGEGFSSWARSNPEDEYALWMTIHHPEHKIEHEMEKRVRSAERAPRWAVARAAVAASMGLSIDGAIIEQTIHDGRIGNAIVVGLISLVPFGIARDVIKNQLPEARAFAKRERELYERGMEARSTAKMIIKAGN